MLFDRTISRKARKKLRLSQHAIPGFEQAWISRWESGKLDPHYSKVSSLYHFFISRRCRFTEDGEVIVDGACGDSA